MKKIFTGLFSLMLLTALTSSGFATNKLTISSSARYNLKVWIDGKAFSIDKNCRDQEIHINELRPGNHTIKIY